MTEKIQTQENICPACGLRPISANGKCGECLAKEFKIEAREENSGEPINLHSKIEEDYVKNEPKSYNKNGEIVKARIRPINQYREIGHIQKFKKTTKPNKVWIVDFIPFLVYIK